jgi:hypothetical protein
LDQNEPQSQAGQRVLYITIFDHKERTTRIYTRDGAIDRFYSVESDVPLIDLEHGLLEVKFGKEIDNEGDPVAADLATRLLLKKHHQSVMDEIHYSTGKTEAGTTYTIENGWKMTTSDTMSTRERSRTGEHDKQGEATNWRWTVELGRNREVDDSQPALQRDVLYLEQGHLEGMRQLLDVTRGQWIERYTQWVIAGTRARFQSERTKRVNGVLEGDGNANEKKGVPEGGELNGGPNTKTKLASFAVEEALMDERGFMEKLFVYEVEAWEGLVWRRMQEFVNRNDIPEHEKERLRREWRANCWKRLDANIHAMDGRIDAANAEVNAITSYQLQATLQAKLKDVYSDVQSTWQAVIRRIVDSDNPTPFPPSKSICSRFSHDIQAHARRIENRSHSPAHLEQEQRQHHVMVSRLKRELMDVEYRIAQGLDCCDQFWDDQKILECRHPWSKFLFLSPIDLRAPHDVYSRALKANNGIIHIRFICHSDEHYAWFADVIRALPSVTSIDVRDLQRLRLTQPSTPLFLDDGSQSIENFLDNDPLLADSRYTRVIMKHARGYSYWIIAVSFIGPSFSHLILRITHRSHQPNTSLSITVRGTSFTLNIPTILRTDDITLSPFGSSSSELYFERRTRNTLIIRASSYSYEPQDVQLFAQNGSLYQYPPPPQDDIQTVTSSALLHPVDSVRYLT